MPARSHPVAAAAAVGTIVMMSQGLTVTSAARAQTPLGYNGGSSLQNFNSLPSGSTVPTYIGTGPFDVPTGNTAPFGALTGWRFEQFAGTGNNAGFQIDRGTSTTNGAFSYGSNASSERALGALASSGGTYRFGVILVNNTGSVLTSLTLSYAGEQWHSGEVANTLTFGYNLGGADINAATFTPVSSLNFTGPVSVGSGNPVGALDGNATANRLLISGTINGINWMPNTTLILRWSDFNDAGSDAGLAIDDFSFTAVPEPATLAGAALAVALLGWWERRRLRRSYGRLLRRAGRGWRNTSPGITLTALHRIF